MWPDKDEMNKLESKRAALLFSELLFVVHDCELEVVPEWWAEQLSDSLLWKIQNRVRSLQDRLSKVENEIATRACP